MELYFQEIAEKLNKAYEVAVKARALGYEPLPNVEIPLAKDMAERVEGLISIISPQIMNKGIPQRIHELEKIYGILDWRVALKIAEEVAEERFCRFDSKLLAIEIGIRVGFAYLTLGTVSSPLEGFASIKIRKRMDGKEYFSIYYAGPVRSAGGTAASVSVLIADYLRKKFGYSEYDPSEEEILRAITEIYDYHERVTNLQYLPSEKEIEFLIKHLPVQIDGNPSEDIEVSNHKDVSRIETNRIRNGPCLIICECIAQKSPKLWTQLSKWGNEFNLM
ncbi:MAG: DNA polymerase II large subunit, partial [Nanoarchaeota archaeon]